MTQIQIDYTRRLERLLEVCRNLSAHLDQDTLLHAIIEVASELTHSESSSILVLDADNRCLRFLASPWHMLDSLRHISIPLEGSVAGWVVTHNEPVILNSAAEDHRVYREVDRVLNQETHSLMAVPMIFRGDTIGVIESINKIHKVNYTDEDVIILETLAAQASIAVRSGQLIDETQQAYAKAMELDRLKSDFIAIASHEIRTPLGLVLGHAALLLDSTSEEQRQNLETILNAANRLKGIVEQFTNLDQLGYNLRHLKPGQVVIPYLVQDVVEPFNERALAAKINLIIETPQNGLVVEGDADKISITLRNLVDNALNYTDQGGQIIVRAEQVPGFAKISVTDNGIGIPPGEQEKIFERFYQVEKHLTRHHEGMGLGLSIAQEMVQMHGGKIWVESVENKGSKFVFILPLTQIQAQAAERVFTL